jgi:hypothetical protein
MSYQYECPKCGKYHGREYSFVSLPTSRLCDSCEGEDTAISTFTTQELMTELCKRDGVSNFKGANALMDEVMERTLEGELNETVW